MKKIFFFVSLLALIITQANASTKHVVLLHGLARSEHSFAHMQQALTHHGYQTCHIANPATK